MEMVCNKCKYKMDVGKTVDVEHALANNKLMCPECKSTDVKLVDASGVNIKVDGITEDVIVDIVKELAGNITLVDIMEFFKGGTPKQGCTLLHNTQTGEYSRVPNAY